MAQHGACVHIASPSSLPQHMGQECRGCSVTIDGRVFVLESIRAWFIDTGARPRASFETELKLIHSGNCWDSSRCCQFCHTNHFQITLGMFVVKSLLVPHCSAGMGDCTDCFYFVLKLSLLWHDSEIYSESVVMIHVFALYNIMLQMRFYIAFSLFSAHYNEITKFVKIAYQD